MYLSPFIPSLSTHTASLWELLKKVTILQHFDIQKPVTVQVDASKKGLGATLLQDGHPVAFVSKALTPTEQ